MAKKKYGMSKERMALARKFFKKRFGVNPQQDWGYYRYTWIPRFQGGEEVMFMDTQSKEVYKNILSKKRRKMVI